jgi:hypothetical protein
MTTEKNEIGHGERKYFVEAFTCGVELSLSGTLALSDLPEA